MTSPKTRFTVSSFSTFEKTTLISLKACFSFTYGFLNAVLYLFVGRFASMMTGNLLLLAMQTKKWDVENMTFTATLILSYVSGGAVYDLFKVLLGDTHKILKRVVPMMIVSGILADVLQYSMKSCSDGMNAVEGGRDPKCQGRYLYFLTPVSFITGLISAGYCVHNQDGVLTNIMTGHMRVFPNAVIHRYLGNGSDALMEKGLKSVALIACFFLGALIGAYASDDIILRYAAEKFTPVFTIFSCVVSTLCILHYNFFQKFRDDYEMFQRMRVTLLNHCSKDDWRESIWAEIAEAPDEDGMDMLDLEVQSVNESRVEDIGEDSPDEDVWDDNRRV